MVYIVQGSVMLQVNIAEFRRHLSSWLAKVREGEEIQITSRGEAIARIIPERDETQAAYERLAALRGRAYLGDVTSPIEEEWTADSDHL
jgi:prevent-host-death family protein